MVHGDAGAFYADGCADAAPAEVKRYSWQELDALLKSEGHDVYQVLSLLAVSCLGVWFSKCSKDFDGLGELVGVHVFHDADGRAYLPGSVGMR